MNQLLKKMTLASEFKLISVKWEIRSEDNGSCESESVVCEVFLAHPSL